MLERVEQTLQSNDNILKTTLHQFASAGDVEALESLLSTHKDLNINCSSKGKNTALHSALSHNQQGLVIDYLIKKGADVDAFNSKGYNAILLAIINCQPSTQALVKLIRAGAIWDCHFKRGKFSGLTVLDVAIQHSNKEAVELFKTLKTNVPQQKKKEEFKFEKNASIHKATNHAICPLCRVNVKFPLKISFLESSQKQVEKNILLCQKVREIEGNVVKPMNKQQKKEIYVSRKYMDEFLSHSDGEAYQKICGIEYHGVGNKGKLRKEVSESYAALHAVQNCCVQLGLSEISQTLHLNNVFLIDLCSGKSLTTALCGVLFPPDSSHDGEVGNKFLAVDRLPVHLVPHFVDDNISYLSRDILSDRFFNEMEQEVRRQVEVGRTAILVGMHLCGNLSEKAIEFFKRIPLIKAMVLSPCCLPNLRKNKDSAFSRYLKDGEDSYVSWSTYLKDLAQNSGKIDATPVRSYNDTDMHSIKNTIITAVRE